MENQREKKCSVCDRSYFERNNYFYGKLMTVRDFIAEQQYFNRKRWLINRMINGCGVICGLDVRIESGNSMTITPGMAIDGCGREIIVCKNKPLQLDETLCQQAHKESQAIAICIEYDECETEQLQLPPISCDSKEHCEFNRIKDSFKIRVVPIPEKINRKPFCPMKDGEINNSKIIQMHEYLCKKLNNACCECPDSPCVILATMEIDQQGKIVDKTFDTSSRRKLVYNNPLLYDLIHCFHGDIPKIIDISWLKCHNQPIKWDDFVNLINDGLKVTFNQIMDSKTINEHTFLFAVITEEPDAGYKRVRYIPAAAPPMINDGDEAIFKVEPDWITDEATLKHKHTALKHGASFEIILRGNSILSKTGKALDGSFSGTLPSGNGTQGGDFLSWFSIVEK